MGARRVVRVGAALVALLVAGAVLAVVGATPASAGGPPDNDAFADGQTISGLTGSVGGATLNATIEPDEANPWIDDGFNNFTNGSTWYRYTPVAAGTLTLDTCGSSSLDSGIVVHTGSALTDLAQVGRNDDAEGCGSLSRVSVPVTAGTTYHIVVGSWTGPGPFTLAWNLVPSGPTPPANDAFADAQTISGASGTVNGTTTNATFESGELNHAGETQPNGKTVWYVYTPAVDGTLTFDTCTDTNFDSILGVYTGTGVNALSEVARGDENCASDAIAAVEATADTTYRIAVAGFQGAAGTFTLSWSLAQPPANDAFASAQAITGASGTVDGTTSAATREPGEVGPGPSLGGSVWYRYTPATSGTLTVDTCTGTGTGFDSVVGAFLGTAVDQLDRQAVSDDADACGDDDARVSFPVVAGTTYRIVVLGFDQGDAGPFTLSWALAPPTFTDVAGSHPFFLDVEWMAAEEISTGYQPGPTYRPGSPVTRAAMSAFMYRLAGSPSFTAPGNPTFGDVGTGHPFYAEIEWMAAEDITTGTAASPKPLYKPSAAVSRGAMSAFMYRLAGSPAFTAPGNATFGDVNASHPFYAEIEWMAAEDITTGTPGSPKPTYKPANAVSRGAMSAFMHRLADGPGVSL
jgi:hypothetical protein